MTRASAHPPWLPVIRYRTRDRMVVERALCAGGRPFIRFRGGVIGRVDDALIVRGVDVFPSAIENIVRRFTEVGEFAVDVYRRGELDEIELRIELELGADGEAVAHAGCAARGVAVARTGFSGG